MSAIKINRAINKLNAKVSELEIELKGLTLQSPAHSYVKGKIEGMRHAILTLDVLKKTDDEVLGGMGRKGLAP